ncbi:MAG: hypothetical protein KDC27_15045 [Acidobacteria bacterium]|nr:hypothetical protein [Acidobacteriota bacterium]
MTSTIAQDSKISVASFAKHCHEQMIPVNGSLRYFSVIPLEDGDLQRLVYDPAATTPPKTREILPNLNLVVVGYLEKAPHADESEGPLVVFRRPAANRQLYSAVTEGENGSYLFVAVKDEDVADCHDSFYQELATLIVAHAEPEMVERYAELLREELKGQVRGEVEDTSWKLKEKVLRNEKNVSRNTRVFQDYARESMIDTLTLYLHGLCCDIDVEAGPRQLPSGRIRKRLELLRTLLPPPKGVAVFPEELGSQPAR